MDRLPITYLSLWDIELGKLPAGDFRKRLLSTVEARNMLSAARTLKTLICVSRTDLGAPYESHDRDRCEELCAALRTHADIELSLEDFFGELCSNPLCAVELTSRSRLLVIDCHYTVGEDSSEDCKQLPPHEDVPGDPDERHPRGLPMLKVAADSLRCHLIEQIAHPGPKL